MLPSLPPCHLQLHGTVAILALSLSPHVACGTEVNTKDTARHHQHPPWPLLSLSLSLSIYLFLFLLPAITLRSSAVASSQGGSAVVGKNVSFFSFSFIKKLAEIYISLHMRSSNLQSLLAVVSDDICRRNTDMEQNINA